MLGWNPHTAPGVGSTYTAAFRKVFSGAMLDHYLAGGKSLLGSICRDPNNGDVTVLRPGTLIGKNSSGFYGTSVIGVLTNAELTGSTTYETSAASVTELIRRQGATGTFKITGPPTAAGTVRTATVSYSAASSTNITVTAVGVNEVQRVDFNIAATGGNVVLRIPKSDGSFVLTTPAAWSATDATFLTNLNTVLDVASGVSGGIVATAISATDTDLGFNLTFSGTGYASLPAGGLVSVETLPTSSTAATVSRTITGVDGRFIAGSLIQPTDGTETILSFIPDGSGIRVVDIDGSTSIYAQNARLPVEGPISYAQLIPAVTDTSLKAYVKAALKAVGDYRFAEDF